MKQSKLRNLKRLSKFNAGTKSIEIIIDGEILDVQLPRVAMAKPHERVSHLKGVSKTYDSPSCLLYMLLIADGWILTPNKIKSPFWMINSVEFRWDIAPEYLKCLRNLKDRVLQTYSITKCSDSGSVIASSITEGQAS